MALWFSALKVLVVSDIKRDLGYKGTTGHRSWRNVAFALILLDHDFCFSVNYMFFSRIITTATINYIWC